MGNGKHLKKLFKLKSDHDLNLNLLLLCHFDFENFNYANICVLLWEFLSKKSY